MSVFVKLTEGNYSRAGEKRENSVDYCSNNFDLKESQTPSDTSSDSCTGFAVAKRTKKESIPCGLPSL